MIFENLKAYCEQELDKVLKDGRSCDYAIARCFGAMVFATKLLNVEEEQNTIFQWWDNEMSPQFWDVFYTVES